MAFRNSARSVAGSTFPSRPPSTEVGSTDFSRASTAKSAPFCSCFRIVSASAAEFTTSRRNGTAGWGGSCPNASNATTNSQLNTRDMAAGKHCYGSMCPANLMSMTRRELLAMGALAARLGLAQNAGMGSRGVRPTPRGKPSGLPFHAHFVNVAHSAGLRAPIIYGDVATNDYILESMGCGVAFVDYDNDGWQDIVLLTGRRWKNTPEGATIRLYHNNRDGTFSDMTQKSGLGRSVWASGITVGDYDNDGFDDLFITCWG